MKDILTQIIESKNLEVIERKRKLPLFEITARIPDVESPRGFKAKLISTGSRKLPAVIAECKKASPSKGIICVDYNPTEIAKSYEAAGASCLSVLTDTLFFQGRDADLIAAKNACKLPILRKDFIIDSYQIAESRLLGADCILLIVACLSDAAISDLANEALQLGMDVLIEVHTLKELERAKPITAAILGINNRNLKTFETDINISVTLRKEIEKERLVVSESGIHSQENVQILLNAGISSFLIGESFMSTPNPGKELSQIFGLIPTID
jgi:indole-3-glycerol phosphate synthase